MNIKCITFDKQAQDALPEEIKTKMKADREKAIMDKQLKKMEKLSMQDIGSVILYRGKKEVSKEWAYGFLTVKPSYGNTQAYYIEYVEELYKDGKFNGLKHHSHRVIPETIGRFTGFEDKYGIKAYRGDIIRFCDDTPYCSDYIIKYDDERMIWIADGVGDFMEDLWELECEFVRVIGNIYDNPKILK